MTCSISDTLCLAEQWISFQYGKFNKDLKRLASVYTVHLWIYVDMLNYCQYYCNIFNCKNVTERQFFFSRLLEEIVFSNRVRYKGWCFWESYFCINLSKNYFPRIILRTLFYCFSSRFLYYITWRGDLETPTFTPKILSKMSKMSKK